MPFQPSLMLVSKVVHSRRDPWAPTNYRLDWKALPTNILQTFINYRGKFIRAFGKDRDFLVFLRHVDLH